MATFIKDDKRVTNDPMEAHYIGFNMWVKAVEKAGTTDPDKVREGDHRRQGAEPYRRLRHDDAQPSHHQAGADRRDPGRRPVRRGLADHREVAGDAWSDYLPGSKDLIADWRPPISCGNYNVKTKKCSGKAY